MNRLSVATSLIAERARRSDRRGILRHRALIRNSRLAGTRVKGLGTETRAVLLPERQLSLGAPHPACPECFSYIIDSK